MAWLVIVRGFGAIEEALTAPGVGAGGTVVLVHSFCLLTFAGWRSRWEAAGVQGVFVRCVLTIYFIVYLISAIGLCSTFCGYAWKLSRRYSNDLARRTFRFSLVHLSALFAALLLDHYLL